MNISSFTINVTEDCNFNCSYCYQNRNNKYIDNTIIEKVNEFIFPYLSEKCHINFYGGEPLLGFEKIIYTTNIIKEKNKGLKNIRFSLTSNGSLLNNSILTFLNNNNFSLLLSYDGLSQETHRQTGSSPKIEKIIKKILKNYSQINLEINSVFTPETIHLLGDSVKFIINLGIKKIGFSFNTIDPWDEVAIDKMQWQLCQLREHQLNYYLINGDIAVDNFRHIEKKNIFLCPAGSKCLAIDCNGVVWGCSLISDYFQGKENKNEFNKYCFGKLDQLIKNKEISNSKILDNYLNLRQDFFYTDNGFCAQCDELEYCSVCPVEAALSENIIGKISPWLCEIKKLLIKERKNLWKTIEVKDHEIIESKQ